MAKGIDYEIVRALETFRPWKMEFIFYIYMPSKHTQP
jgi:hypothetical protein